MRSADNRRYSLRIDGQLLDPEEFNEVKAYNPRGLKHEVMKVAAHVAVSLDVPVEVVKHLAKTDRVEAHITAWDVRASRAIGR